MVESSEFDKPRWQRDLIRFLPLKSQFVLSGNIKDLHLCRQDTGLIGVHRISTVLDLELKSQGYKDVIHYDPANGFSIPFEAPDENNKNNRLESYGVKGDVSEKFNVDRLTEAVEAITMSKEGPVALIADFASQLAMNPDGLVKAEHNAFTRALVASQSAAAQPFGTPPLPYFNTVIWLVDKEGDLPDWLIVGNPKLRHIPIGKPDHKFRRILADNLIHGLHGSEHLEDLSVITQQFVEETDGLLLSDLKAIVDLARAERISVEDISDAIRRYKVGVTEDPWKMIDRAKVRNGEVFIKNRVKGQDHAVTHILDIVKRGITGVGSAKRGGRPRGVAFLAGPTGVGKTELAKTLTSLLFGDESAYIRFDMSEFSAEHSDQRLIGAPPGYVGYDVGGELTNAIREKPFSVVLFDEIEKAHPRILDKFLQILDDGRLTSGRGDQVFFSEALIVFTSNLGVFKTLRDGSREQNVDSGDSLEIVSAAIQEEIARFFKLEINRPELLNRMGENIIVFDFIREDVAGEIFESMLTSNIDALKEQLKVDIQFSPEARERLKELCVGDLSNGGRGIRNKMEKHFINALSRAIFDMDILKDSSIFISEVVPGIQTDLKLQIS